MWIGITRTGCLLSVEELISRCTIASWNPLSPFISVLCTLAAVLLLHSSSLWAVWRNITIRSSVSLMYSYSCTAIALQQPMGCVAEHQNLIQCVSHVCLQLYCCCTPAANVLCGGASQSDPVCVSCMLAAVLLLHTSSQLAVWRSITIWSSHITVIDWLCFSLNNNLSFLMKNRSSEAHNISSFPTFLCFFIPFFICLTSLSISKAKCLML
jgi:hypothetical protein